MRGTIVRIGAIGAGALLAVGLLVAQPAGASGSDRDGKSQKSETIERSETTACFDTSGKTQGRSYSDPDWMTNGGADKPGCPGGFDADQDGNNGCGNDADREDDNNGNCGRTKGRPQTGAVNSSSTTSTTTSTMTPSSISAAGSVPATGVVAEASTTTTASTTPATVSAAGSPDVAGVEAGTMATATEPNTEVLGQTLERPSVLARTGAGVGVLTLVGGLLCGGGRLALLARRFLRID